MGIVSTKIFFLRLCLLPLQLNALFHAFHAIAMYIFLVKFPNILNNCGPTNTELSLSSICIGYDSIV